MISNCAVFKMLRPTGDERYYTVMEASGPGWDLVEMFDIPDSGVRGIKIIWAGSPSKMESLGTKYIKF